MTQDVKNAKEVILCDNDQNYNGWDELLKTTRVELQNTQDKYLKEISIEILKKANIQGSADEIANEFVKIYNLLKSQLNGTQPKTQIPEQTVFDDYIICLEDGKKMQMLNRHLKVKYHMSFQDYKRKWNLPIDYPCTCKNYSKIRANIAKKRTKKARTDEK